MTEKRPWMQMECPKCASRWEVMAIDSKGKRAVDSDQRICKLCKVQGVHVITDYY